MKRLIEDHITSFFFAILLLVIGGYIDMRSISVSTDRAMQNIQDTMKDLVNVVTATRTEQLLRSDEIEWVQEKRRTENKKKPKSD